MSMGLSLGLSLSGPRVGTSTPVAGASPTTFAIAPTVQYHPNSQNATLNGSNQVLDCADLLGLAYLFGNAAIAGNKIRNPNMTGAVAGTPGTLPTNWGYNNTAGLTTQVVSTFVSGGIQYIRLKLSGTTNSQFFRLYMDGVTSIAASTGQAWTGSYFVAIANGSTANITSAHIIVNENTSSSSVVLQDPGPSFLGSLSSAPQRFSYSFTTSGGATVAAVQPLFGLNFSASGVAIDITLDIGYPVLEQAASATALSAIGPVQMTDALGRKFWRFTASQYLIIANALAGLNHRQCAVFMLWRNHRLTQGMDMPLLSTRYSAYTDNTTNTNRNNGYVWRINSQAGGAFYDTPRPKSGSTDSLNGNANSYKMYPGTQPQVGGFVSRAGASAGTDVGGRFYNNTDAVPTAQSSLSGTADVGAIIGAKAVTGSGNNLISGAADAGFDLYEFAFWKGTLTDAQGDAIAAAMVANWSIPTVTGQLLLPGDSITYGTQGSGSSALSGDNLAVVLTAPGTELIPTNYRVLNIAVPGSGVVSNFTGKALVTMRDEATNPVANLYPGGASKNVIAVMIGINDMRAAVGNLTAAAHYANFVALLNTTTTGYLQRGFKVWAVTPTAIGTGGTDQSRIVSYRALLIDPNTDVVVNQFLTDVQANSGQAFDGLVNVLPVCKITSGAFGTLYLDATDAADTGVYANDTVHMQIFGYKNLATGGDTPQYGYGAVL